MDRIIMRCAAIVSLLALAAALIAQYGLGLDPCVLCLYQRGPFIVVALLGGLTYAKPELTRLSLGLSAAAMAINSAIAFYHTGVEQKWWVSALEACKVSFANNNAEDLLASIMSAPTARCDEIPWVDPVFGLSMANYNIPLCLGLALLCVYGLWLKKAEQANR